MTDIDLNSVYPAGIVRNRADDEAIVAAWIANGRQPLSAGQVLAITGPAPVYPTRLVRMVDSNPASDGWVQFGPNSARTLP